ncbi:MAG: transglutaminase-like domain-containing protein [Lactobacillales bacterium]|jgi:hypothetical protein|nr:transglutaminase-like domain-containing protein [Lactobacillales bacterium]
MNLKKRGSLILVIVIGGSFFGILWYVKESAYPRITSFLCMQEKLSNAHLGEFSEDQLKKASEMLPKNIKEMSNSFEKVGAIEAFLVGQRSFKEVQEIFHPFLIAKCYDESGKIYASLFYLFAKVSGIEVTIEQGKGTCFFNAINLEDHWYCLDLNEYLFAKEKGNDAAAKHFISLKGYTQFCVEHPSQDISRDLSKFDYFPNYNHLERHAWLKGNSTLDYEEVQIAKKILLNVGLSEGDSDYQKVIKIRNYLSNDTSYDICQKRIDTLFFEKRGNCEAFSRAFYVLAKLSGMEVTIEYGKKHMFNTVRVGDRWYCMDVCWYAVPEVYDSYGKLLKNVRMNQYSLGSYETFLKYDHDECHNISKHQAYLDKDKKSTLYDTSAREEWIRSNCVHKDLEAKSLFLEE